MKRAEIVILTKAITAVKGVIHERDAIALWYDALSDVPYPLAHEALRMLFRETDEFITPSMIRKRAALIAQNRLTAAAKPSVPTGLTAENYQRWSSAWRDSILAGSTDVAAQEAALLAIGMVPADLPTLTAKAPSLVLSSGTPPEPVARDTE